MSDFFYIAIDKTGKVHRGVSTAANSEQVAKILAKNAWELISCQEQLGRDWANLDVGDFFKSLIFRRVKTLEKISFAHHLSIMLKTGVPIIEATEILGSEAMTPKFKKLSKQLALQLEQGKTLSSFLEKEDFFSPAHLAILKSGEASGKVSEVLKNIGDDLRRDYRLVGKIKNAMTYPAVVTFALLGISTFIIIFVLPKVGEVFRQMNLKIPLPTRILLGLGTFINQNLIQLLLGIIFIIGGLVFLFKTTSLGKKIFSLLVPILPVVKKLAFEISLARFIRSLSSLLASGVSIGDSLEISAKVFVSHKRQKLLEKIGEEVKRGVSLTNAFKRYQKTFSGLLVKMCSVGEKSGRLAEVLQELALFYEEEVEQKLENFSTIIEPVLMLFVGIGVGAMILSIIAPIYQMMGSLTQ